MTGFRYAQFCPLARAAEILGERWTLLVIRELFCGPQRFSDLRRRLPGLSSSVLAERLSRLEERGIVRQRTLPAPAASRVYELAEAGRALERPMGELMRWGIRWLEPEQGDHFEPEWLGLGLRFFAKRSPTPAHRFRLTVAAADPAAPPALDLCIEGGPGGTRIEEVPAGSPRGGPPAELGLAGPALPLMGCVTRTLAGRDLVARGILQAEGDLALVELLPDCFDFSPEGPARERAPGSPSAHPTQPPGP